MKLFKIGPVELYQSTKEVRLNSFVYFRTDEYSEIVKGYSLMSVQKEMKAFPHNLYECRKKIEDFPTRLFYEQIPQDKLFQFYSGIAICGFLGEGGKPKKKKWYEEKEVEEKTIKGINA